MDGTVTQLKRLQLRTDGRQLHVRDSVQRSTVRFEFPEPVTLEDASVDTFYFPVETAVRFRTSKITLESIEDLYVWTTDGAFVDEVTSDRETELPVGEYLIDVTGPIKTYFRVGSELRVRVADGKMHLEFGSTTNVRLGVRSLHERPAGEIVVPDDPHAVMDGISHFGSALKTLSPERSFPTLRGHPPTLSIGEERSIPDEMTRADSGIEVHCPPSYRYVFPIAPLAYYLGAEVVPSSTPKLSAPSWEHDLSADSGETFDDVVSRTLQRCFFLDCLTRTEGFLPAQLHEREKFEERAELDFERLYEQPITEQVGWYLDVPFELLVDLLPTWRLTADVQPDCSYVEALPYLAADLAIVRCPDPTPADGLVETPPEVEDFFRSSADAIEESESDPEFVNVPSADSVEHAWIGDSKPINASNATVESFETRLDRQEERDEEPTITVVTNDEKMLDEMAAVREIFGRLQENGAHVEFVERATVAEFESVLHSDTDFLHYIGHVEREGVDCEDGMYDVPSDGEFAVDAFILNGCRSYKQGRALVEGGCVGGVVTASEVLNTEAVDIGADFARLLGDGFTLRSAIDIAGDRRVIGNQYLVVGDGNFRMAERVNTTPVVFQLERTDDDDEFELLFETYPTAEQDMGCMVTPYVPGLERKYLTSGPVDSVRIEREELVDFLDSAPAPVVYNDSLTWTDQLIKEI